MNEQAGHTVQWSKRSLYRAAAIVGLVALGSVGIQFVSLSGRWAWVGRVVMGAFAAYLAFYAWSVLRLAKRPAVTMTDEGLHYHGRPWPFGFRDRPVFIRWAEIGSLWFARQGGLVRRLDVYRRGTRPPPGRGLRYLLRARPVARIPIDTLSVPTEDLIHEMKERARVHGVVL